MVEAVVAIPFFIAIFFALGFVSELYVSKQRTVATSRQRAWELAMKNCKGAVQDATVQTTPGIGGIDFGALGNFPGVGDAVGGVKMAASTIKAKVPADANKQLGGFSQDIQTMSWVPCNEEPVDGDLLSMAKHAWQTLVGW
jgi:hypothetical protein